MRTQIATYEFEVHTTPLEKFNFTEAGDFVIEFDDAKERRLQLIFKGGGVALRITLIDCFDLEKIKVNGKFPRHLLEIIDSLWIHELTTNFRKSNPYDNLMEQVNHFVLPLGDNVVEVAAWEYELRRIR